MSETRRRSIAERIIAVLGKSGTARLAAGLFVAVLLPAIVRYGAAPGAPAPGAVWNTLAGVGVALCVGAYLLSQVTQFPGVRSTSYVMPCFAATYGALLLAFFFLRLDYTRSLFLASFTLCAIAFFAMTVVQRSRHRPAFAVVPFGEVKRLGDIEAADFLALSRPMPPSARVDALVADFRADLPEEWQQFIADWVLEGRPAYHWKQTAESITGRVDIEHLSENSFGSLDPGRTYLKIKQAIDVALALVALVLLALPGLVLGLVIRLDSPGPALFRQERIGYRGRPFTVIKFRTMATGGGEPADDRAAAMTRDGDPRVTRIGRFLRRSRLDEVPQILNILRGEMSWIGPRPEARSLSSWYEAELPFYRYRHVVRPGITGWAQVNQGHVVEPDAVLDKLHYDFYYIKYFSPWLDALIALRTAWIMASGRGAR